MSSVAMGIEDKVSQENRMLTAIAGRGMPQPDTVEVEGEVSPIGQGIDALMDRSLVLDSRARDAFRGWHGKYLCF
jgi:hypothetical protein